MLQKQGFIGNILKLKNGCISTEIEDISVGGLWICVFFNYQKVNLYSAIILPYPNIAFLYVLHNV